MRLRVVALCGGTILLFLIMGMRFDRLPFIPRTIFSDVVVSHYPNAVFLRQTVLEQQRFPLWRETIMAGQPFAANPLNKTAYPLQWLTLMLPAAAHINVMLMLHLLIGGWGMWRWARELGMGEEAAVFSAFAYAFAPRVLAHLGAGHVDVVYAMAWFPWLMLATASCSLSQIDTAPLSTSALRIIQLGLFAALIFLADVRISLFAFITAGVYAVILMIRIPNRIAFVHYATAAVLFLALSVVLIVPLIGWSPYLSRAGLSAEDAGFLAMRWGDLISLVVPAHGVQHEQFTYFGLPVLLLAVVGLARESGRHRWLWVAAIVLVVLYALGTSGLLWSLLIKLMPALLWFRVPARAWLILVLLMPLLAGWGLHHLLSAKVAFQPNTIKRWRLAIFGGIVLCVLIGVSSALFVPLLASGGIGLVLVGVPLGILMLLMVNERVSGQRLALVLGVLLFIDLAWSGYHWAQWRSSETWLDNYAPLGERLVSLNPQRIYSPSYSLPQQVAAEYDLRIFGGIDPFQLSSVVEAVEQGSGVAVDGYSITIPTLLGIEDDTELAQANRDAVINTAVLGAWGVSHVVAGYEIENDNLQLVDEIDGVYIYANTDIVAPLNGTIPDWAEGWQGLPSADEVARLNELTMASVWVSSIAFIGCAVMLIVLKLRSHG